MALADYRLCDVCGNKCFYDAELSYDFDEHKPTGLYNLGDWACICNECAKTHKVVIVPATASPSPAADRDAERDAAKRWDFIESHWYECDTKFNKDGSFKSMVLTVKAAQQCDEANRQKLRKHFDAALRQEGTEGESNG